MKNLVSIAATSLVVYGALIAPAAALAEDQKGGGPPQGIPADGRGNRLVGMPPRNGTGGAVVTGNGIDYHNGPVMKGTVNVYFIWYGDWSQDTKANGILTTWAQTIGGSSYMAINTTYGDTTGSVSGGVSYGGSVSDPGSLGTSLSDSSISTLVSNALGHGLPVDTNGLYFVLTAPGVAETSGFLSSYCGWHTYGFFNGANIKYSFVGDAGTQSGCSVQFGKSPNGDPAVDAMISVMSHELEETASDPNLNAWYDSAGEENADKCAWSMGTGYTAPNGSWANTNFGGHDYLIQQNWLNANGGSCAISYAATQDFNLSVSPTSQTLPAAGGTTGNYAITATPSGGFTGTVSYSLSNLPAGVTASAISSAGTFTLTAPSGMTAQSYQFTITGTSTSPALTHSIFATLVISPPAQPTFTINVSPATLSVSRGTSGKATVTITGQNGFTGTVSLAASPTNKTGIGLSLSPTSLSGSGTSILTVSTNNSAKKGNTTLTVTGTSGSIVQTASTSLHIQ